MIRFFFIVVGIGMVGIAAFAPQAMAQEKKKTHPVDVAELYQEVRVLRELRDLDLTIDQMRAWLPLAKSTSLAVPRAINANATLEKILAALRSELVQDTKDDTIEELEDKLYEILETQNVETNDAFPGPISNQARKHAVEAAKKLELRQILAFAAKNTLVDPRETIEETLNLGKDFDKEGWGELRDETADLIAEVLGGLDEAKFACSKQAVAAALERLHTKKADGPQIDREVNDLLNGQAPTALLQNGLEVHVARILSMPRLENALESRLQAKGKAK